MTRSVDLGGNEGPGRRGVGADRKGGRGCIGGEERLAGRVPEGEESALSDLPRVMQMHIACTTERNALLTKVHGNSMQRLVLFKRLVDVARESERESRQSIFGLLIVCLLWLAIDGEDDPEQAFAV